MDERIALLVNLRRALCYLGTVVWRALSFAVPVRELRSAFWRTLGELLVFLIVANGGALLLSRRPVQWPGFLYALGATLTLRLVVALLWVPYSLYQEQRAAAADMTWRDVEIKPFIFPGGSGFGVGLELVSHKPEGNPIDEVQPRLVAIAHHGEEKACDYQLPLLVGGASYTPAAMVRTRYELKRDGHRHTAISVANTDAAGPRITLKTKGG